MLVTLCKYGQGEKGPHKDKYIFVKRLMSLNSFIILDNFIKIQNLKEFIVVINSSNNTIIVKFKHRSYIQRSTKHKTEIMKRLNHLLALSFQGRLCLSSLVVRPSTVLVLTGLAKTQSQNLLASNVTRKCRTRSSAPSRMPTASFLSSQSYNRLSRQRMKCNLLARAVECAALVAAVAVEG